MDDPTASRSAAITQQAMYFLGDQIYCCEFEDGAIILDMRTAAYLGIDAQHLFRLRACVGNWPKSQRCDSHKTCTGTPSLEKLIVDLLARRILTTTPTKTQSLDFAHPTTTMTNTEWTAAPRTISATHLLPFFASLLRASWGCRARRLASLVGWIRRHQASIQRDEKSSGRCVDSDLMTSFLRGRIWFYTAHRHCLLDSLVLSVFLTKRMVPCTLIIGVSIKPFAAHAWVQIGECVLNDTVENVLSFTPILAVGSPK
jgi:transglutaminase superfamily protein